MIIQRIERKYRNLFRRELFRRKAPAIKEQTLINDLREGLNRIKIIDTNQLTGSAKKWYFNLSKFVYKSGRKVSGNAFGYCGSR
jgi:hypothetical protein